MTSTQADLHYSLKNALFSSTLLYVAQLAQISSQWHQLDARLLLDDLASFFSPLVHPEYGRNPVPL